MYCSNCGIKQSDSSAFCSSCGAKVEISTAKQSSDGTGKARRLTFKPLHYPFTSAIGVIYIGWLADKPWNAEFALIVGMAFILGLVIAIIEIAIGYFRK